MPVAIPPLRDQLRQATAAAHAALEATALMRAVADGIPGTAEYTAYLQGHWRIHAALEPRLAASLPAAWTAGRLDKSAWLQSDLQVLGARPPSAPVASEPFDDDAQALGAMYVLEGATLGLGMVTRRLPAGHPARQGAGRFMAAYGAETGARWSAFLRLLAARDAGEAPALCASALRTFGLFQQVFESAAGPAHRVAA